MFFVVSLMLMVGLFTNTAPAHDVAGEATAVTGGVTITPDNVTAEDVVDLTITYRANVTLVDPTVDTNTDQDGLQLNLGRIRVTLPENWGSTEATPAIHLERPPGNRDATYLVLTKSGSVVYAADPLSIVPGSNQGAGWGINIDVDKLLRGQRVILTIRNLKIPALNEGLPGATRTSRYADITEMMRQVQIEVVSDATLDRGTPSHPTATFLPNVDVDPDSDETSDSHPTIIVNRKTRGELDVSPAEVTAGSTKDFKFTYRASEALEAGANNVIEIRLPAWDADPDTDALDPPSVYQHTDETIPAADDMGPYVHLSGSVFSA